MLTTKNIVIVRLSQINPHMILNKPEVIQVNNVVCITVVKVCGKSIPTNIAVAKSKNIDKAMAPFLPKVRPKSPRVKKFNRGSSIINIVILYRLNALCWISIVTTRTLAYYVNP